MVEWIKGQSDEVQVNDEGQTLIEMQGCDSATQ